MTVKEKRRLRYSKLRAAGFSSKDASKLRSWSDKRVDTAIEEFRLLVRKKIVISYKELTEKKDLYEVFEAQKEYNKKSSKTLTSLIKGAMKSDNGGGMIGQYRISVIDTNQYRAEKIITESLGMVILYNGYGENLHQLLSVIASMTDWLIYETVQRYIFVVQVVKALMTTKNQLAKDNANEIIKLLNLQMR